jgi:hypothetical protein
MEYPSKRFSEIASNQNTLIYSRYKKQNVHGKLQKISLKYVGATDIHIKWIQNRLQEA